MKIAILTSGNLGYETLKYCLTKFNPCCIVTDSHSNSVIDLATANNIKLFKGRPGNGRLASFFIKEKPDVILSINYLFIIEKEVIDIVKYAVNFHGSLLPKYRGRTPHVWSIINNEPIAGITAHIIDEGCDTGPLILQKEIPINWEDTGSDILKKFGLLYPEMVNEVLETIYTGTIRTIPQDHSKATYFGKRSPEDGLIDWDWQKERIRNWIRAQADPYPGAFTFLDDQKVIIDKVVFSEAGYEEQMPNGLILECTPSILVKTPNGVISIEVVRNPGSIDFKKGKIFKHGNRVIYSQ